MCCILQEAEGVALAIPMPGHPVPHGDEASVLNDCKQLQNLIRSHDVTFLLTDTRESRWLPTLLCASYNKVDSYTIFFFFFSLLNVWHHGFIIGMALFVICLFYPMKKYWQDFFNVCDADMVISKCTLTLVSRT